MPKVSVILPIYNQEKNENLSRCIHSILTQTPTEIELILINVGSTDQTSNRCEKIAAEDERISVIHQEHHDMGAARNAGIAASSSDFVAFMECDDFVHEKMLQILYNQINRKEMDIAICDYIPIEEGASIPQELGKQVLTDFDAHIYSKRDALHGIYDKEKSFTVPWGKLYRKEIFAQVKYPVDYIDEDEFIAHELLNQARNILFVDLQLYYYVIAQGRKGSITPIPMTVEKFDKIRALYERARYFKVNKLKGIEERSLSHFAEHFFWFYLQSQKELPEAEKQRKEILKLYKKLFFRLIINPRLTRKERIVYTVFRIHPYFHKIMLTLMERKRLVKQS